MRALGLELRVLLSHLASPELLISKEAIAHYGLNSFSSDFSTDTHCNSVAVSAQSNVATLG